MAVKEFNWGLIGRMMIMILLVDIEVGKCCLENEKIALLEIKSFFNYPNGTSLSSWGLEADCCNWEYVVCNPGTGRVAVLYLGNKWDSTLGADDHYLNASLFLPFPHLKTLALRSNHIVGCIKNEGFERLSILTNLEDLELGGNKLGNHIFSSLAALSSLKSLSLDNSGLNGTLSIEELNNLTSLQELYMGNNMIEGFKSSNGGEEVLKLSNLEKLIFINNRLNNSVLSSISGLSSLKILDIRSNLFKGAFNLKGLDALSSLEELILSKNNIDRFERSRDSNGPLNLSVLYLEGMRLEGRSSLLESLGELPHLKTLHLGYSKFKGRIIGEGLYNNLSNVEELYLDGSSLDENSLQSFEAMSSLKLFSLTTSNTFLPSRGWPNFKKLEKLYLNNSKCDSSFLQTIGKITSLKTLSLSNCKINGTIPSDKGFCQLKHIQELDISNNDLNGDLPLCLANLTFLQILDISHNNITGNISSSPLRNLTSLQKLDLSDNHILGDISVLQTLTSLQHIDISNNLFEIPVSLFPFFNHSKLAFFNGGDNRIYADTRNHGYTPKFQLEVLVLHGNGSVGEIPKFLYYQNNLRYVDLSHLKLRGGFPYWLMKNNTELETLYLKNNSISGSIHSQKNRYRGNDYNCSRLTVFDASDNNLSGEIPVSLSKCSQLSTLDLSGNNLSGKFPEWTGNLQFLKVLDFSHNKIHGKIPSSFVSTVVRLVYLSENKLQGSLGNAFFNCTSLLTLDISHNLMTGSIPAWISRLNELSILLLNHNNLEGDIPIQLCKLDNLNLINFSHNNLSGSIPPCIKCGSWYGQLPGRLLSLYADPSSTWKQPVDFTTKGNTYTYHESSLLYFSGIDLSCNGLTGKIPIEFGNLSMIQALNLSYNSLTGLIPAMFSNLDEIESLDLSNNNLQGEIPTQLTRLYSLAVFNVSYNNLSGKIPEKVRQFATFDESSYRGNPSLCGWPLPENCKKTVLSPPSVVTSSKQDEVNNSFIDMEVFYVSFGVAYIMVLLGIVAVLYINPRWRRVWFYFVEVGTDNCYYFIIDNVALILCKFRWFCRFCR